MFPLSQPLASTVKTSKNSTNERLKPGRFHYAVISDIHLGHRHNPTERIVVNLKKAFPRNAETASLDVIYIAGDVFDTLITYDDPDIGYITQWIIYMLTLCQEYGIMLVVLEGTPSHDREQSKNFEYLNDVYQIGCDLRYIKTLSIEYFPEFDVNVLFVPDELAGGPEKTLQDVKDMMRSKGLEKIDHAIMHGQFEFQLPAHVNAPKHNSIAYLELVEGHISIGHDHTEKHHDSGRIHAQGSFDRLGHGYESPKGHMRFLQQMDGSWDIKFVVNEDAMQFITIDCNGLSLEETFDKIEKRVEPFTERSFFRIRAQSDHPIFTNMDSLIRLGPLHSWTKDAERTKVDESVVPLTEEDTRFIPITITRENLVELVLDRIVLNGATGPVMDAAEDILLELFPMRKEAVAEV